MKNKKLLSTITVGALSLYTLALCTMPLEVKAETMPKWNVEKYGDRIDVDSQLNQLSKNPSFLKKAEKDIKEQAEKINFNETQSSKDLTNNSSFTYDGGTKKFLNKELKFKEFTMRSVGENIEIWVANDLSFQQGDPRPAHVVTQEQVDKLRDEFDKNIYPKDTEFFGTPDVHNGSKSSLVESGVVPKGYYEGSDKIIMLVDNIIDDNYKDPDYPFFVAGFFWKTLENYIDRNIITVDTSNWEKNLESTFFGTTIHELQHLIHADNDSLEESWINEGMSTFSEHLGGYGHNEGSVNFYLDHPENSLVNWDEHKVTSTGPETIADYGQVYLFTLYMNDKLGKDFIKDLALNKNQGINSIKEVLKAHGSNLTFTKLYQNFITALALDTDRVGNGVYNFDSINLRDINVDNKGTKRGMTVNYEKALQFDKEGVPAWGGDFKILDFKDKIRSISFNGVDFLSTPWKSVTDPKDKNNKVLWSNEGDEADNPLIFEADLTNKNTATLKFDNFIDIEEQWDFGVVQISTDNGKTWKSLSNENTSSDVVDNGYPKIKENLPGFTGTYEGWKNESFDLSKYAGQKILVSFRYLTDWGNNQAGWYVDNIEIPEIGYTNDGSSIDDFKSFKELAGEYVNYTVTFINEKEVGKNKGKKMNYKVINVDPFNVTQQDALTLRQLFHDGKNYMITSYGAPTDDKNPVDFTYKINFKTNNSNKK